jgi:hypothetical protein
MVALRVDPVVTLLREIVLQARPPLPRMIAQQHERQEMADNETLTPNTTGEVFGDPPRMTGVMDHLTQMNGGVTTPFQMGLNIGTGTVTAVNPLTTTSGTASLGDYWRWGGPGDAGRGQPEILQRSVEFVLGAAGVYRNEGIFRWRRRALREIMTELSNFIIVRREITENGTEKFTMSLTVTRP